MKHTHIHTLTLRHTPPFSQSAYTNWQISQRIFWPKTNLEEIKIQSEIKDFILVSSVDFITVVIWATGKFRRGQNSVWKSSILFFISSVDLMTSVIWDLSATINGNGSGQQFDTDSVLTCLCCMCWCFDIRHKNCIHWSAGEHDHGWR